MTRRESVLVGGAVSGLVGGAAILVWGLLMSWRDPEFALEGPAFPFVGAPAVNDLLDLDVAVVGIVVHFILYALWGVLFALCVRGFSFAVTLVSGLFWGFLVWAAMDYAIIPALGAEALVDSRTILASLIGYLGYGLVDAFAFLPFQEPVRPRIPVGRGPVVP